MALTDDGDMMTASLLDSTITEAATEAVACLREALAYRQIRSRELRALIECALDEIETIQKANIDDRLAFVRELVPRDGE